MTPSAHPAEPETGLQSGPDKDVLLFLLPLPVTGQLDCEALVIWRGHPITCDHQ